MARSSLTYILGFSVKFFFQPFHQSLVQIGPVVLELIKMQKANDRQTTDTQWYKQFLKILTAATWQGVV
jgi:hypothetical protein